MIDATRNASAAPRATGETPRNPETTEEAARQFEEILVRQLVRSMTDNLFKDSLAGEGAPQWMSGYAETQRDVLNTTLADHLIESGTLRFSDLMLRQWQVRDNTTQAENEQ